MVEKMAKNQAEQRQTQMRSQIKKQGKTHQSSDFSFVKLCLSSNNFDSKLKVKELLTAAGEGQIKPLHIDLNKKLQWTVLKFKTRVEAEFCAKKVIDAKN